EDDLARAAYGLASALQSAEVYVADDRNPDAVVTAALSFLAGADEAHVRRAALQAELATIEADLVEVGHDKSTDSADPPRHTIVLSPETGHDLVERARAGVDEARGALQAATKAQAAAERRLADHRAALARVTALEADLAGAERAAEQSAARVEEL